MIELKKYQVALQQLCQKYGVAHLYLFGSASSDKFNAESDIDLLVQFGNVELSDYFSNYLGFKQQLENLFNRKIDLLEEQTVKNPVLKRSIDRNKVLVYG